MEFTKKLLIFAALLVAAALLPASASAAKPLTQTRVIITLSVSADAEQGAAISQATNTLLASLPGDDYKVTNRYEALPFVAISGGPATMAALLVLKQSGLVVAIERDGTVNASSTVKKCKTVKRSKRCAAAPAVH